MATTKVGKRKTQGSFKRRGGLSCIHSPVFLLSSRRQAARRERLVHSFLPPAPPFNRTLRFAFCYFRHCQNEMPVGEDDDGETTTTTAPTLTACEQGTRIVGADVGASQPQSDWQSCQSFCISNYPSAPFFLYTTSSYTGPAEYLHRCWCKSSDAEKAMSTGSISGMVNCVAQSYSTTNNDQCIGHSSSTCR